MVIEFDVKHRDDFLKTLAGDCPVPGKAFLYKTVESEEGVNRIILLPVGENTVRVVVEKKTGEHMLGDPIFKQWDDISNFERLRGDTWLIQSLFTLLAESKGYSVVAGRVLETAV